MEFNESNYALPIAANEREALVRRNHRIRCARLYSIRSVALVSAGVLTAQVAAAAPPTQSKCSVFGDPPAQTYQRFLAAAALNPGPMISSPIYNCGVPVDSSNNPLPGISAVNGYDPATKGYPPLTYSQADNTNPLENLPGPKGVTTPLTITRYACEWYPSNISKPLPLIVYLHPSDPLSLAAPNAWNVQHPTALISDLETVGGQQTQVVKLTTVQLNPSDTSEKGFILLAPQGRMTHHYYGSDSSYGASAFTTCPNDSTSYCLDNTNAHGNPFGNDINADIINYGWDNWYRQTSYTAQKSGNITYPENLDVDAIDHFIEQAVQNTNVPVDTNRIYVVGWSNGGAMAQLYGLSRNRKYPIAAVGVYSAPNPWGAYGDPCQQTPSASTAFPPSTTPSIAGSQGSQPTITIPFQPSSTGDMTLTAPSSMWAPTVFPISPRPVYQIHNQCDVGSSCPSIIKLESLLSKQGVTVMDRSLLNARNSTSISPSFNPITTSLLAAEQATNPQYCNSTCGGYGTFTAAQVANAGVIGPVDSTGVWANGTYTGYTQGNSTTGFNNHITWPSDSNEMFSFFASHSLTQ